ncbi:MAG: PepSY-associated TM helix domain-containing protein [Bacteroidota bacterium]
MKNVFFIVCISGTFATLSNEMDWLFFEEIRVTPSEKLASKNIIVKQVENLYPEGKISYWAAANAPYLCDIIYVIKDEKRYYVFANPYTGEVQGATTLTFQRFFRDLHYYLFIPFQIGHFTVLIFGFLLFISLTTALLFYKKWYKKLFELKTGKGKLVLYGSLHRLVGVWSVPFVILFSVTGIWYFLERTNIAGISRVSNTKAPELEMPMTDSIAFENLTYNLDYDKAIEQAKANIPNLVVKDILPPSKMGRALYLNGISEEPLVRNRANRIYLHPVTYEVIKVQNAAENPTRMWLNDIADPLHFGYWGGLVTKVLWFFGGLAISALVLTGLWISQKRKVRGEQKRKAQKMGGWKYVNWIVSLLLLGFMYTTLIARYQASLTAIAIISLAWLLGGIDWWYLFVYRIRRALEKEQTKKQNKYLFVSKTYNFGAYFTKLIPSKTNPPTQSRNRTVFVKKSLFTIQAIRKYTCDGNAIESIRDLQSQLRIRFSTICTA